MKTPVERGTIFSVTFVQGISRVPQDLYDCQVTLTELRGALLQWLRAIHRIRLTGVGSGTEAKLQGLAPSTSLLPRAMHRMGYVAAQLPTPHHLGVMLGTPPVGHGSTAARVMHNSMSIMVL